tara:strand:+ start:516 stop:722 length:207 start_codon:yes stop_codon:yes gene_type:complete
MKVRSLTGFDYPASAAVRRKVRQGVKSGHRVPHEERGQLVEIAPGQIIDSPPEDLIDNWLERGLVEVM